MYARGLLPILTFLGALIALGAITSLTPTQAATPILSLAAPAGSQSPNAAIDVEVRITNVTNMGAFEFDLEYDHALVQVTGITLRDFLGQATPGCDPHARRCAIALGPRDQANGTSVGAYSYGTGAGASSNSLLAVLHLRTTSRGGTASLHLANALITDIAANPTAPTTQDATLEIQASDTTPPIIMPATAGTAGAGGWYRSGVRVSWGVSDPESGINTSSGCETSSLTTETAGTTLTCSATNGAGLSSTNAVTIKIDTTPPNVPIAALSPSPNAAGWNNSTPVAISFTSNGDEGAVQSGVANCTSISLSAETVGTVVGGTCSDVAGNTSAEAAITVKIDTTAPIVSVTGVTRGATYMLGAVPTAGCATSDALSGVATEATLSLTGGVTNGVGTYMATCSGAADKAGNSGSASASYTVVYNFRGFFQPVDNPPVLNTVNAGRAVPVKFSLSGNRGLNILAAGYPLSQKITCDTTAPGDAIEETSTAGSSSLSYDATLDQYTYVWKTDKAWAGTCRQFIMKLNDGTEHRANFRFTK